MDESKFKILNIVQSHFSPVVGDDEGIELLEEAVDEILDGLGACLACSGTGYAEVIGNDVKYKYCTCRRGQSLKEVASEII